jgi:hypothetical protein
LSWPLSCGVAGLLVSLHTACPYSLISPPRILRRHIFAIVRSVMTAGALSRAPGGRRLVAQEVGLADTDEIRAWLTGRGLTDILLVVGYRSNSVGPR